GRANGLRGMSAARLQGAARALALELTAEARAEWGYASEIIARGFRAHRQLASGDRRRISEPVDCLIRMHRRLAAGAHQLVGAGASELAPAARDELTLLVYEAREGVAVEALQAEAARLVRGRIDLGRAVGDEAGLSRRQGLEREAVR